MSNGASTASIVKEPIIKNINVSSFRRFKNLRCVEQDFRKFNLLYGWNYSGKTTLSRILANFNGKTIKPSETKEGDYKLTLRDEHNTILTQNDSEKLTVKVFNSDYVEHNLFFEKTSTSNVIVVTDGADEIIKEIKELEGEKNKTTDLLKKYINQDKQGDKDFKKIRKTCAVDIAKKLNLFRFDASNLPAFENELGEVDLDSYIISDEDELFSISKTYKSDKNFQILDNIDFVLNAELTEFSTLIEKQINPSEILKDLQSKNANNWVKDGITLHQDEANCLFCGGMITEERLKELDHIFTTNYEEFGEDLESLSQKINTIAIKIPHQDSLTPSLVSNYIQATKNLNIAKDRYNLRIEAIQKIIQAKSKHRGLKMASKIVLRVEELEQLKKEVNGYINIHNKFVKNSAPEKEKIKTRIAKHYIATMLKEPEYKSAVKAIEDAKIGTREAQAQLRVIMSKIEAKKAEISNIHKGAEEINKNLELLFMGNPTVCLKVVDDVDENGKAVKVTKLYRDMELAEHLSEGEKTSIAFAHFLATLNEAIVSKSSQNQVLFVDDPISSLDHNHIYAIYTILKSLRDKFNQMFVSTHNFELYRLLTNGANTKEKTKITANGTIVTPPRDSHYYIKRLGDTSTITKLPASLVEFRTEYNFLFHNLYEFRKAPDEDMLFTIGHCARRFLEIYTNNRYPNTKKLDQKLDDIAKDYGKSPTELAILYKIINEDSHSHTSKDFDKSYLEGAINTIFSLLESIDKPHYDCLVNSCGH